MYKIKLGKKAWEKFMEILNRPAKPNPRLQKLFKDSTNGKQVSKRSRTKSRSSK